MLTKRAYSLFQLNKRILCCRTSQKKLKVFTSSAFRFSFPVQKRFYVGQPNLNYSTEVQKSSEAEASELLKEDSSVNTTETSSKIQEDLTEFKELGIDRRLCEALLKEFGITYATPTQAALLTSWFKGREIILRDTTGSGKTFGIIVALLSQVLSSSNEASMTQSLLLVPNKELAIQVDSWCRRLLGPLYGPRFVQAIFKGKETDEAQALLLKETTPLLVVGTPNRIFELMQGNDTKHILNLEKVKHVVLDEVDHLLRLPARYASFKKVYLRTKHPTPASLLMNQIFGWTRPQVGIMSATLNREIRFHFNQLNWLERPVFIDGTNSVQAPPNSLEHMCVVVTSKEVYNLPFEPKKEKLNSENEQELELGLEETSEKPPHFNSFRKVWPENESQTGTQEVERIQDNDEIIYENIAVAAHSDEVTFGLLFIPNQVPAAPVIKKLKYLGVDARPLYTYFGQGEETNNPRKMPFLLVGTYFEARGLDVQGVTHVYIAGYPGPVTEYLHIAGRAGRLRANREAGSDLVTSWGRVVTFLPMAPNCISRMSTLYRHMSVTPLPYPHLEH